MGDLVFAPLHCHSVVQKQPMIVTASHGDNRKYNELSKDI